MKSKLRFFRRGQKGFTLIELLIVVAILGVLAAVIIPNVGRFLGRGEEEARRTEKTTVQNAVFTMMIDNELGSTLPTPILTLGAAANAVNDMGAFPDTSTIVTVKDLDPDGVAYQALDQGGYYLYEHDIVADNAATATTLVNYVDRATTVYYYTVDADGEVHQWQ
ncbi:type II secretion system protein [Chloroflexota bacterium]